MAKAIILVVNEKDVQLIEALLSARHINLPPAGKPHIDDMPIAKLLGQVAPRILVFTSIHNRVQKYPVGYFYVPSLLGQGFFYPSVVLFLQLHTLLSVVLSLFFCVNTP